MSGPRAAHPGDRRWPGVELRHLATLRAVSDTGSFRAAGAELGYAQSAVSQHVALLERAVGYELVMRSRGPGNAHLTEAGAALLTHVRRVLASVQAASSDLEALGRRPAGRLWIGIEPGLTRTLLPELLRQLCRDRPEIRPVPIEIADPARRSTMIASGELDAAFMELPAGEDLQTLELGVDRYVLLVPVDDPLAALGRTVEPADLGDRRLLGRSASRLAGLEPADAEGIVMSDPAAEALVAAGCGIAVLPRLAVAGHVRTAALELGALVPPRVIGLCWHRDRRVDDAVGALRQAAATVDRRALTGQEATERG